MLGQESHEIAEVIVADINHWCDREVLTLQPLIVDEELARIWFDFYILFLCRFDHVLKVMTLMIEIITLLK